MALARESDGLCCARRLWKISPKKSLEGALFFAHTFAHQWALRVLGTGAARPEARRLRQLVLRTPEIVKPSTKRPENATRAAKRHHYAEDPNAFTHRKNVIVFVG